jgi:hypothetical protein
MKDRIKKQIEEVLIDLALPVFIATCAVGVGMISVFLVISVLWEIWSFF